MTSSNTASAGQTFAIGGDLPVRRVGFGAMRLVQGTFGGPIRGRASGVAVLRRAVELGVDHIDTAAFYGTPEIRANALIREALAPYAEGLVIATKVGPLPDESGMPSREATPEELRGLVEDNLRVLGLDRLDLVYLRVGGMAAPDDAPIADRFTALAELQREGLIRHLGVSNVSRKQFDEASAIAPIAAVQNHFSVQHRTDAALLERCRELHIAFVPFFPLGGGFLPLDAPTVLDVAVRHGASPTQVVQAWLLRTAPNVLLIPGTGVLGHLEENAAVDGITLTVEDLALLEG